MLKNIVKLSILRAEAEETERKLNYAKKSHEKVMEDIKNVKHEMEMARRIDLQIQRNEAEKRVADAETLHVQLYAAKKLVYFIEELLK